ncbi:unnamed protein product [Bursaphelenchus xylophilus]|uniref:(pine wood nematode) hypothetical protein n=1 Tax=Bursaphelenchus xylophilus TaxID=6326 RepID=A0A1I7RME0_BURXY|nr:unnamed protein product [Bursaphelenchus xylophilus]CAG9118408.1 unnamed protein product [Bursaphelenchus xylophilus]
MLWLWKNLLIVLGWPNEKFVFEVTPELSAEVSAEIGDFHNELRRRVAEGTYENYGAKWPGAKNMYRLAYSSHLASAAQYQANNCVFEHQAWRYGQNVCVVNSNSSDNVIRQCLRDWSNSNTFNWSLADEAPIFNETMGSSGHFIQMIWAKTTHVGCGIKNCSKNNRTTTLFVCNYYPPGNCIGQPIFKSGRKCRQREDCGDFEESNCETDGLCSTTFDRLAADKLPLFIESDFDEL